MHVFPTTFLEIAAYLSHKLTVEPRRVTKGIIYFVLINQFTMTTQYNHLRY